MKIRTQLLLACFVLSVLPLTGIVVYSYRSSRRALESAYQHEASRVTAQMDRRLGAVQTQLDQSLAALSVLPLTGLNEKTSAKSSQPEVARNEAMENIQLALADVGPMIERLQIVAAPRAPRSPRRGTPAPPVVSASGDAEAAAGTPEPPAVASSADEDPADAVAPVAAPEPVVVEVPRTPMPAFRMPPDFSVNIRAITALSRALSDPKLTAEERQAKNEELKRLQEAVTESVRAAREESDQLRAAEREQQSARRAAEKAARIAERQQHTPHATPPAAPAPESAAAAQPAPAAAAAPALDPSKIRIIQMNQLTPEQRDQLRAEQKRAALLFGHRAFNVPVRREGEVVGHISAQISTDAIVKRILGTATDDSSEIPFAVDREGTVYTRNDSDRGTLNNLGIIDRFRRKEPLGNIRNWVVAMSWHRESGLRIGVARPVGENFEELRKTAARNFGWGIGVIAFALLGMLPIADHFTRDVKVVTEGAERIAQGDLQTRVPVRTDRNEFGQLAMAFNRMAEDLSLNQQRLVEQERARQEQEIQQRLLALEYDRKSVELEDARTFQLSMLPKHVPQHDRYDVAVLTQTAAEVGGDYYDFHTSPERVLSVTIGDATGHGAKAGTMVTVIKTLFAAYDAATQPAAFLGDAAEKIKRMDLGRMAMALSLARFDGLRLTVASAGMPPILVHRAESGTVDEIALHATPLGTLGVDYAQTSLDLHPGDMVLLMSDGLPELLSSAGQQFGYVKTMQEFSAAAAAAKSADDVIAHLAAVAKDWHGDQPPNDDVTFVAVRVRA